MSFTRKIVTGILLLVFLLVDATAGDPGNTCSRDRTNSYSKSLGAGGRLPAKRFSGFDFQRKSLFSISEPGFVSEP